MSINQNLRAILFSLTIVLFCSSCEGLKFLTLHNKTGHEVTVTTKPQLLSFGPVNQTQEFPLYRADSMTYKISSESSLQLMGLFTGLLFNMKIKEQELPINYLRIETATDTIIASNKTEIINLIKNSNTRYKKKIDKHYAYDNNKNFEAIIIRR